MKSSETDQSRATEQERGTFWAAMLNLGLFVVIAVTVLNMWVALTTHACDQGDLEWLDEHDYPSYIAVPYFWLTVMGRSVGYVAGSQYAGLCDIAAYKGVGIKCRLCDQ